MLVPRTAFESSEHVCYHHRPLLLTYIPWFVLGDSGNLGLVLIVLQGISKQISITGKKLYVHSCWELPTQTRRGRRQLIQQLGDNVVSPVLAMIKRSMVTLEQDLDLR